MITSPDNAKLKLVRKLARKAVREQTGQFIVEGEDLLDAARNAGWRAVERLVDPNLKRSGTEVDPRLLAAASSIGSGVRAIGIFEQRWQQPAGPLCVYLHRVADPGNVGTIIRSADAFGASSVVLGPGCADPYSPKAVRATMGSIFHVPLAKAEQIDWLPGKKLALVPRAGVPLRGRAKEPVAVIVGAERGGLPKGIIDRCDDTIHIPMSGTESLNAAMAVTVSLYELTRAGDEDA